ncbi:hypothetical protein [Arenimonas sp.]|uniref:hypothetical protein n=1 Tax=Arenimonas sp. TaxID=1872635 RepID=UPI0039E62760
MRPFLLLALALSFPLSSVAKDAKPVAAESQFIDRSVVSYPKLLGGHALIESSYDPEHFAGGVGLKYQIANAPPGLMFNVFIYPLGDMPAEKAMKTAMDELRASFDYAQKQGLYSDVVVGEPVDFEAPLSPSTIIKDESGKKQDAPPPAPKPGNTKELDPRMRDALAELVAPDRTIGKKLPLSYTFHEAPNQSLAYVFYHQLFLIKFRITLPKADMEAADFDVRMDKAVRDLAPGMVVENFGDCGTMTIDVPDKGEADPGDTGAQLIREMARIQRLNCANSDGGKTKPGPGREQIVIEFPAGTWR